ncbi:MAG: Gfo/Idh/MocA family oxidoreductase [Planctomycetes bacterium]|nr:Gfo/Idh/MocA family oxidoreductase [Planctomycetota bacterium]
MAKIAPAGIGTIGCGAFGCFYMKAFGGMDRARPVAAAKGRSDEARRTCRQLGVRILADYDDVINSPLVQVVHVASPPASHYELAMRALRAGKNVFCEKPPALRAGQADELARAARQRRLFCAPDFVMRYSPITPLVRDVLRTGALGDVLAADFFNCASDAGLAGDHWFWDKKLSGGIFIEHGVHFFDLYAYWLGPGRVVDALAARRGGDGGVEDRAACTVRHASGALVSHYHGFDQLAPMDRTHHRLVCEMGDVRIEGWLPRRIIVDAAVDDAGAEALIRCIPAAEVTRTAEFGGDFVVSGRGRDRRVSCHLRLDYTLPRDKQALYAQAVAAALDDQLAWAADPAHRRLVTEQSGADAVRMAQTASRMAAGRRAAGVRAKFTDPPQAGRAK